MNNSIIIANNLKNKYELKDVLNKTIQGDCIEAMQKLPEEIVDMVFVDPPYFLQLPTKQLIRWSGTAVEGINDSWDTFKDFNDYDDFTVNYLREVKRLMKPKATLWVIGMYHNIHRVGKIMQDLGFWILNDVIWIKKNPMPNFLGVRFTNATEVLIWAVKNRKVKGHTFNKNFAQEFDNGKLGINKLGTNVWFIPLCTGEERIKNSEGKKIHPTQKPEELLRRVILTSTKKGDVILDPMAGTGTTGYIAKKFARNYIMIEKESKYIEVINNRLKNP